MVYYPANYEEGLLGSLIIHIVPHNYNYGVYGHNVISSL